MRIAIVVAFSLLVLSGIWASRVLRKTETLYHTLLTAIVGLLISLVDLEIISDLSAASIMVFIWLIEEIFDFNKEHHGSGKKVF